MRDPYEALGVAKGAKAAEIKSAYRKLAKTWHPDHSKHPKAKEKFSELNTAYEILGDAKKRAAFDRGEIDADGKPRAPNFDPRAYSGARAQGQNGGSQGFGAGANPFTHFAYSSNFGPNFHSGGGRAGASGPRGGNFGGFDPSDIFGDLFGAAVHGQNAQGGVDAQSAMRAAGDEPVLVPLTIPVPLAIKGGIARVSLPSGKTIELKIPEGTMEGQTIRLRGQGQKQNSRTGAITPCDLLVSVKLAPHPHLRVEERDLKLDLPITLYEAVLGGVITVPTFDGTVEITLPPGGSVGKTLRLRGKGLPATSQKGVSLPAGDMLVTPRIVLAERGKRGESAALETQLEKIMVQMKAQNPHNPRQSLLD